jgi:hypothetical protein
MLIMGWQRPADSLLLPEPRSSCRQVAGFTSPPLRAAVALIHCFDYIIEIA